MALIDISGLARVTNKLGSAVVMTVQPAANLIEMASQSSSAWVDSHAADLAAKTERQAAVRVQTNADAMRKALANAQRTSLDTNELVRSVQSDVALDALKTKIHDTRLSVLVDIDSSVVEALSKKANLTDADILKAAKIGNTSPVESEEKTNEFDINSFKSA